MLTVIVLTYNEERHILRAIESVRMVASKIVVVDSFSTDRTVELAKSAGALVLQHPFVNQAKQFQWALDNVPVASSWIMRLDADEVVEPDLIEEIGQRLPLLGRDVAGVCLKRKHIFLGRWIRHGGRYPLTLLRIWRRGQGRIEDRWMDEHTIVWGGRTVTFEGGFSDENLNDLTFFTEKHNKYATREAVDVLMRHHNLSASDHAISTEEGSKSAAYKRILKERIYNNLPLCCGPLAFFVFRYFFLLGFLDGREGLIYHFLQGFWYRFLVHAKTLELERGLIGLHDPTMMHAELQRLTGLKLDSSRQQSVQRG